MLEGLYNCYKNAEKETWKLYPIVAIFIGYLKNHARIVNQ